MDILKNRCDVTVDPQYMLDATSDNVHITLPSHKLDYRLTVGNRIGLSAIIPHVAMDHNFGFNIDLRKPYRDFKDSSGQLGFDTSNSMLFFGYRGQDEAWIAMAPNTFIEGHDPPTRPGYHTGPSRLSGAQYRMIVAFFAFILAKNTSKPFICTNPYGIQLTGREPHFDHYFSIMCVHL
jgi:hypothetical protein